CPPYEPKHHKSSTLIVILRRKFDRPTCEKPAYLLAEQLWVWVLYAVIMLRIACDYWADKRNSGRTFGDAHHGTAGGRGDLRRQSCDRRRQQGGEMAQPNPPGRLRQGSGGLRKHLFRLSIACAGLLNEGAPCNITVTA